jgi:hypothetical protein
VTEGVAEGEEQGIDNKYRRAAKEMINVYNTNPEIKAKIDASTKPLEAMVYTTGVIKNPDRLTGTTHMNKLMTELESIYYYGREQGVAEAGPTSMYYSEELAQKVFDLNPNLDASGKADAVLDAGWPIAVKDLGAKSANSKFAYDEDFPSDFVSMYAQLQKQGVSEGEGNREMWDRVRSKGVVPGIDREKYTERPGLEGPFSTKSGKVVYYDKQEGKYYDPGTDFYISHDDYQAMNEQSVVEGYEDSPVAGAITRRILLQRSDLLSKYGPVSVTAAIDDVADYVGDVEEIGSSDVSGWIKQVEKMLQDNPPEELQLGEASLASMRDYFSQSDNNTVAVDTEYGTPERKQPANVPPEIQTLINKMYRVGKITPQEFDILKRFQAKTGMNVGIKEADMTTGNQGYDSMLAVMKAVEAGHDATFNLGGEPITLDYNEARFLAGKYKAFLKAGRQEEFLKYMESPMSFDRLMKQLRDLMDKQKNFKGSVQGERGIEESSQRVDSLVTNGLKIMRGPTRDDAIAALKTQVGERDFNERRGFYNFYVRQLMDMYSQQGVTEGAMPASVIRIKEKIRLMSAAEKKEYFKGKTKEQLQKMARSHGYGENSNVYAKYATEDVAEGIVDAIKTGTKKAFKALTGPDDEELLQRLEKETGGKRPEKKDLLPQVKENEYWCKLDHTAKLIPEGYKKLSSGYITRT